jgi:hypothetical protein
MWEWFHSTAEKRSNLPCIQRALEAIRENSRVRAIKNAHARRDAEEYHRELLLFIDDCKLQGLDWEQPEHRPIITRAWLDKLGYPVNDDTVVIERDDFEMVRDHSDMDF